ncbi:hypothetical protein V1591_20040 [Enterobacter roggenkampii]|uniref:hypothetical protein n=1 Tax=Enterobacter roggenkampii TaxID=1812935 RepID=UPI0028C7A38F|nr:hypothetical protein [Enterobacter roggenkampii]HCM9390514.1 hypothetical protein [Enterobacter roggenkampii]
MSTITKEWLQQKIADMEATRDEIPFGLDEDGSNSLAALRIALASLEAEPVPEWTNKQCLEFLSIAFRHAEINGDLQLDDIRLGVKMVNGSRAAMLQGSDGTLTNEGTITATQFKPVADLYGLTSPTGGETSFTFDAVEARDFIDGGWSCQEYVELERFQEAVSGNSPVIPDGFCIMPKKLTAENGGKGALSGEFHVTNRIVCQSCGGEGCEDCNDEGGWDAEIPVSWDTIKRIHEAAVEACSLPAAPQQEVK